MAAHFLKIYKTVQKIKSLKIKYSVFKILLTVGYPAGSGI